MNNGDMPAMPVVTPDMQVMGTAGLTKREAFAMAAMQGLCAASDAADWNAAAYAHYSVICADALLAELDKGDHNETT